MSTFQRLALSSLKRRTSNHPSFKQHQQRMFNFGSTQYAQCFDNLPTNPDVSRLREQALRYLEKEFDPRLWYDQPVTSILKGHHLSSTTTTTPTYDAFQTINGSISYSTPSQVSQLLHHISTYQSPYNDLRTPIRSIEDQFLTKYAGFLIGNQAVDFGKQDGVTELEESIMANAIERRLNDLLVTDDRIQIRRRMAFVGCVSNFSNFLDLFRKILRNLELGIPVTILGRSNTTQHSFRYTDKLIELLKAEGVDPGMVTYAATTLEDTQTLLRQSDGPMYVTCSRHLAQTIKRDHANTIASTGGPNTLVAKEITSEVLEAIRVSATIESSGQCTALRHVVVPGMTQMQVQHMFDDVRIISKDQVVESLKQHRFADIIQREEEDGAAPLENYIKHPQNDIWYRLNSSLPSDDLAEHWRTVVLDVTTGSLSAPSSLSRWLIRNQPISLAMNVDWNMAKQLFETTSLVVYTVGSPQTNPSLTCQARPQEGEIFGEFPVRRDLNLYTKFPVVVPSATPGYDAVYDEAYLDKLDCDSLLKPEVKYIHRLLNEVTSNKIRGYCIELANYLVDATATNPKVAFRTRTVLWGIQRPPLNDQMTILRYENDDDANDKHDLDVILPPLIPFLITNARNQVEVSVASQSTYQSLHHHIGNCINVTLEDDSTFRMRTDRQIGESFYNVVVLTEEMVEFPMVGQFVSLYFPMGHIKSTTKQDDDFVKYFGSSKKWLKVVDGL